MYGTISYILELNMKSTCNQYPKYVIMRNKTCVLLQHSMFFNVTVDILNSHIKVGLP